MDQIKLIYFSGCPNYELVKYLLTNTGYDFEAVNQNDLSESHPFKHYTSPTILKNGNLVIGDKTDSPLGGCSTQIPNLEELKRKLGY
jgi:hypothetical protein